MGTTEKKEEGEREEKKREGEKSIWNIKSTDGRERTK